MTQLAPFDLQSAIQLGGELWRRCAGEVSAKETAEALVEGIYALQHRGQRVCVLVRAMVTRKLGELPAALRAEVLAASPGLGSDASCVQLIATRGIEPRWNAVEQSRRHQVLLLGSDADPLVAECARQLKLGETEPPEGAFYLAEAATSGAVADKQFVSTHGVRSVLGFGTTAWPGESLLVIVFVRRFVERSAARTFAALALYAKLAWIETLEARAALGEAGQSRAHADALEELVRAHETQLIDAELRMDGMRAEVQRVVDSGARMVDAQNLNLRRTQRAMLNVIEDLREARSALESKVEARTHELAQANAELESRNRELEEFVYIASHDLQEPLRTVAGYLQMIERRYGSKLGVEADEFIRFAIDGAQRMQALIESLLLYSRVAKKERVLEEVELNEVLDIALQNLAARIEETGASIERLPLPRIRADRMQMVQLFQNLLSNALKFAGDKPPRIHVTSESLAASEASSGACTVSVRDEGIGFNPKYAGRIFQVFRRLRRDTPGTGIGLSICKKIVERHGGWIEAHSTPGEGATFTVHFTDNSTLGGAS